MQKNQRKDLRKLRKQANNSCNRKQFLTVPKLCEFGLIRKFRSRASLCKKNQLKRSYKTQVMIKRSSNTKLFEIQILNFQKHVQVVLLDRGEHNEEVGVGFVGFGQTSKKLRGFENQGLICKENIHVWVPGLRTKEKKEKEKSKK